LNLKTTKSNAWRKELGNGESYEAKSEYEEEELDENLFRKLDDMKLNQGTRNILTFDKDPSPENAFFIYPEDDKITKNVLFIHASVSLMK
jgi:hypothetical protein